MEKKEHNKVSIIVPVYKVEKYLNACLQSITGQTYSNLEIILIDDGSPDNCPQICDEWRQNDARIKVIHQENLGVSVARNRAIESVSGEYILFVDSDDWIETNMVEVLVDRMESSTDDIDAVFFGYIEVDEDGNSIRKIAPQHNEIVNRNRGVELIFGEYGTFLWNKMFRTKLIDSNSFFDQKLKIGEDELWMVDALKKSKRILLISNQLYYYRRRMDGASNDYNLNSKRLSEITAQQKTLKSIEDYGSETLTNLVNCRLYYCGYKIMRLAYYQNNYAIFDQIDSEIEKGRRIWYKTHNNFLGNCRRKMVETMMRIRIPQKVVRILDKNDLIEWKK